MSRKPRMIVFDLDYTLWPFYIDLDFTPPFRKNNWGEIIDYHQKVVECYKDVPDVLEDLHGSGYKLAVASRASEKDAANQLIRLFGWDRYFSQKEIYPSSKISHFKKLHEQSGIEYREMLFFDDDTQNITDVRSLQVTCVLVKNGITKKLIAEGLRRFYG
ncbi:UNVERIFIED_CONTAM: hypothetical protein PYX00_001473 [Menopon gallinae]|uniref:Magnesium-dependent phosphatase 1 n=1 Tax=Menopon gallinae TaxID=328185 RepID=A0AAW2ICH1_9NEOP